MRVTKITSRIDVSWIHSLLFCFWPTFNSMSYNHNYQKDGNQVTFEPHNSLQVSFTQTSFEFCWTWIFPWIKLSSHSRSTWDKLGWFNLFWQFLCEGLSSFNPKGFYYSYAWACSLCEERTPFCTGLISRKLYGLLLMFSTAFTSLGVLVLFTLSITFFIFMHCLRFYFI